MPPVLQTKYVFTVTACIGGVTSAGDWRSAATISGRNRYARKARLAKLLAKSGDGIQINEHLAREIGAAMFEYACKPGHVVSKHRDSAYRAR
jgi:hypothetical protein